MTADAWRLRKAKTLVKLLALASGHRMHREALMAVLWPDRDTAAAANNLHQALYVARRVVGGASGGLFSLRDDIVLLSEGTMPWLDTDAFDAARQRARRTRDPQDYRTAAALYRGDLLPEDRFEDWAEGPREALRERHLGMLVEYAEVLHGLGEHTQVVDIVGAVTTADPFHEGAYRMLMTALAASGRRYEALAAFDRLREALAEEYAADPEPATKRLYRDLLTNRDLRPAAPPAIGSAAAERDAARAKEGPRPEQTSFVGRRRELAEIDQALGRTRLLTLTGPGGAGKTRLAYEAAARLVERYPDGVHVAELASLSRPELVPQTVASVLDVPLPETGTAEVALAMQLAGRRLLLVLDNCEHLLDACARLATAMLRTCPDVVVLATSREPLRVGGEVTWRTPSLALPDLRDLPPLARLAELESVRLFVERARDAAAGFVLDETTAPAVAEICVRLDGMPLALELAAARTSALAPAQIAARLDDALRVLGRGSRSAVTRQQTLHATLAWSHDLLDERERVLFRRLAVFAGSMSLEAVEHVCDGDGDGLDVVDLLSRLVDKSLVQVEHAEGVARYRLLETIRQFADQRLRDAGERAARVRAHRDWYVAFAAAHDPERAVGVVNDTPQALDVEHDNLRAALSSGLADDPAEALRLAVSLWRFWLARGHFAEGSRWLEATLAAASARTPLRARALLAAAAMRVRRGDLTAPMLELALEASAIMREVADEEVLAQTLHLTGLLSWVEDGAWEHGVQLVEEGRSLAARVRGDGVVASATHMLGVISLMRGASRDAEAYLDETLGLLDRLPAEGPGFFSAATPGWFWELGPGGQPRMLFTETVLLYQRVGADQAAAYTLSNLAYAARMGGEEVRARGLVEQSVSAFQRLGDLHGEGVALCHLANLHRLAGELSEAGELLDRSRQIRRRVGDRRGVGVTVVNQGLVAAAGGDLGQADRLLREAFLLFEEMEDGPGRWGALLDLGLVLLDAGEHQRARRVLRQWRELPLVHFCFRPRAWALLSLAKLERQAGDETTAADCVDEARRRFVALGDTAGLAFLAGNAKPLLSGR
ncbi:MAG TPA: BTAD domain-containing putative transcriptional regulator [Actinomycetota bacterium]|nr:BTAD domain-containing putative transcriptional regulator [Actinomycetota bacterium]